MRYKEFSSLVEKNLEELDIKKGDIITNDMLAIKGPGGGLLPRYLEIVVGREAKKDIEEDHPITWENI